MKQVNVTYPIKHLDKSWNAAGALVGEVPQWLNEMRQQGLERLQQGLPNRRSERWKYTNLKSVANSEWSMPLKPGEFSWEAMEPLFIENAIRLVFVDGVLATASSELTGVNGLRVSELTSQHEFPEVTRSGVSGSTIEKDDVAEAVNRAFLYQGLLIEVESGVSLSRPLQILFIATSTKQLALSVPRVIIRCGARSKLDLVEYHYSHQNCQYLHAPVTQLSLEEQARCCHARVNLDSENGYHLAKTEVSVSKDADYRNFCGSFGGGLVRHDLSVGLKQSGANACLSAAYLGGEQDHIDFHTVLDHEVAHTTSTQLYKGILGGSSRAVFNGKVLVRKNAHSVNASQLNKTLLLSSDAEIDTKPQLEIDNDDVKCSHGATVGRLSLEELFYLQSRGINKKEATNLLLKAFLVDAIEAIKADRPIQGFLMNAMQTSLNEVCNGL